MPVLDTAAAAPISPHDAVPETGSFATALTSDAGVPSSAAAAATVSATATGLPASAPGTLPDVVAASSGMPANSVPAAHVAHVAPVLLPTSGLAATAATAPSRPAVASIGLPLMGLAQPTALAGVSQAAVQLSGMTEHAGSLSRHHSAALSLLGEDGQALVRTPAAVYSQCSVQLISPSVAQLRYLLQNANQTGPFSSPTLS